jgi:DNA-binding response OmpR family regulator
MRLTKECREWHMAKRILVVDDDKEVREIVTFALTHNGYEVIALNNGQQLQEVLTQQLPDILILDIMMPGEDGYRLCHALRTHPRTQHIPIIMMTAHTEEIYERISLDLGVAEHMTKPFHPLALVERVKALLSAETQN